MAGGGSGGEELNLVPYLDVMVNLIMFMITITAYIVELREAPVLAPSYSGDGGGGSTAEEQVYLTLFITKDGYGIVSSDDTRVPPTALPKEGSQYANARLQATLRQYKNQYDVSENLVVTPDPTIPYRQVIEAMDAVRRDKEGPLYPGVTFAMALGGN